LFSGIFGRHNGLPSPGSELIGSATEKPWSGVRVDKSLSYRSSLIGYEQRSTYISADSISLEKLTGFPSGVHSEYHIRIDYYFHKKVDNPFEALKTRPPHDELWFLLKKEIANKSRPDLKKVRPSGFGKVDLLNLSFDLDILNKAILKQIVDARRDDEIFQEIKSDQERSLFTFKRVSKVLPDFLLNSDAGKNPLVVIESIDALTGGEEEDFNLLYSFGNMSELIKGLAEDQEKYDRAFKRQKGFVFIAGVNNLAISPQQLPAELHNRLKREIVLSRLPSGLRARLLNVEKQLVEEVRQKILKIAAHDGADTSDDTVKTEYLWMSLSDDRLKGTVIKGTFKDRSLDSMTDSELRAFHKECREDYDSLNLCEFYFRHIDFDDFRKQQGTEWTNDDGPSGDSEMDCEQAMKILDLTGNVEKLERSAVDQAFRRAVIANAHDLGRIHRTDNENLGHDSTMREIIKARHVLWQRCVGN